MESNWNFPISLCLYLHIMEKPKITDYEYD